MSRRERTFPFVVGQGPVPAPIPCAVCGLELGQGEGYAFRCSRYLRELTGGVVGLSDQCSCPDRVSEGGWHAQCFDRRACERRWAESGRPRKPRLSIPPEVRAWLARRQRQEAAPPPAVQLELGVELC